MFLKLSSVVTVSRRQEAEIGKHEMIFEDKEKSLKERVEFFTALFGCVTAGVLVVKTTAETIQVMKSLVTEMKDKKDKGEDND